MSEPTIDLEALCDACTATWDEWDWKAAEAGDPDHLAHAAEIEQAIRVYLERAS